jgi:CBS-domain-containing membrane protein
LFSTTARERWQTLEAKLADWEQRFDAEGELLTENAVAKFRELAHAAKALLNDPAAGVSPLDAPVRRIAGDWVRSCSPDDTLGHAAQMMWENNCATLPVVDGNSRAVGLLTDRDICMACYTQACAPAQGTVATAMSRRVGGCTTDTSIEEALELMTDRRVRLLPVLAENRRVAAVITLGSIARFIDGLAGNQQARGLVLLGRALAAIGST